MRNYSISQASISNVLTLNFLALLFFFSSCSKTVDMSQLEVKDGGRYYLRSSNKPFSGQIEEFHQNGNLKVSGQIKRGQLIGSYTEYYTYGQQKLIAYYDDNGNATDYWQYYDSLGNQYLSEQYRKDVLVLSSETENGLRNGITKSYYPDGAVRGTVNYSDGKRHGAYNEYYTNGRIKVTEHYVHGDLEGTSTYYYTSGAIRQIKEYVDNEAHGYSTQYNEDGSIDKRDRYDRGQKYNPDEHGYKDLPWGSTYDQIKQIYPNIPNITGRFNDVQFEDIPNVEYYVEIFSDERTIKNRVFILFNDKLSGVGVVYTLGFNEVLANLEEKLSAPAIIHKTYQRHWILGNTIVEIYSNSPSENCFVAYYDYSVVSKLDDYRQSSGNESIFEY